MNLVDIQQSYLDRARATIEKNLTRMVAKQKITVDDQAKTLERINLTTDLPAAAAASDLIIEAITENFELKTVHFHPGRPARSGSRHSGFQYLLHIHHQAGCGDQPSPAGNRYAFFQSRTCHETR